MILDKIVEEKKIRLSMRKKQIPLKEMRIRAEEKLKQETNRSFYEALKKPGLSIIGEFKQASPSLGDIKSKISLTDRMEEYNASMDAISCLTEEDYFKGSAEDLKRIRTMSELPILRKDFMIDEYQFFEAKEMEADAVLLIAAILDDHQLYDFYQLARSLSLDVLVETHDEEEMERALKINPGIIGVNNRNLKDFSIHLETTQRLSRMIPKEKAFVAESGIITDEDMAFLKECGVDACLVGQAFMESENPGELSRRWKSL